MGRLYPWVMVGEAILALLIAAAAPQSHNPDGTRGLWFQVVHFLSQLLYAAGTIQVGGTLLFSVLLPRAGLTPAPILLDALFGLSYVAATLFLLSHHGVNLSGIIATSAVLTAVIGFSLQDTLGNFIGGVSLQAERSIAVGDWVRIGDAEGRVHETRWRQTSIETRDWDTVVIPNSVLMKSVVTVLGRRAGGPRVRRVLVSFNVDFQHGPDDVIEAVQRAIQGVAIPGVAANPAPLCILNEFRESYGSYLVAYWTGDMGRIPVTSSDIRRRTAAALQRAGIAPSVPSQNVLLARDGRARKARAERDELDRRLAAMASVDLLRALNEPERLEVAAALTTAPFGQGEIISRQGEEADYLFILTKGEAVVRVSNAGGVSSPVAILRAGDVFGEMGMMTGQPRTATVEARTDVVCYRLDRNGFKTTLRRRPEIAEAISLLLTERKSELESVVSGLNAEATRTDAGRVQGDMLRRIRNFFLLA